MPNTASEQNAFVEVCAGHRFTDRSTRKLFDQIADGAKGLIEESNIRGHFKLIPIEKTNGSPQLRQKLFRVSRVDEQENAIIFAIQIGSNDTAWMCRLVAPRNVNAAQLRTHIEDAYLRRVESARRVKPAQEPEAQAEDAPPVIETPQTISVSDFVNDCERIALAIGDLFPLRHSHARVVEFIDLIAETQEWTVDYAVQALNALEARKFIKVLGHGDVKNVAVLESELSKQLVSLGVLKEEDSPEETRSVLPRSIRELVRKEADRAQVGGPFRVEGVMGEPRPVKPSPPSVSPKVFTAPTDAPAGSVLQELERKADAFQRAQEILRRTEPARAALAERRLRAEEELQQVEKAQRELDRESADAVRIVSDAQYSNAANKIEKIRAIIEE